MDRQSAPLAVTDDGLREHPTEIVPGDRSGGPSTGQTIMVSSLSALLALRPPAAPADSYRAAVRDDNVLGKRTAGAREWAFRQLAGVVPGVVADLRGLAADPTTSIAARAKETTTTGKDWLSVPDEDHEGQRARLVLVGSDGEILADRDVIVGRNR